MLASRACSPRRASPRNSCFRHRRPQQTRRSPRVAATDGATTLDQMLGELADDVGAAIADTPDGKILVQAIAARTPRA